MTPDMLAQRLLGAHRTGVRIASPIAALRRRDILSIQTTVCTALGPVAGFKVSAVPDGLPILAPIPARYGTENRGVRTVADRLGIELEVGFEVLTALPGDGLPDEPQRYLRPRTVLELVDTRLAGRAAENPSLKFADLQMNAGIVIGEGPTDWDGADFGEVPARLTADDSYVLDGPATVPGGSALANLDLLLRHLGDHCGGVRPGQIVITGSLCGLPWFGPGTRIEGWIEGLGDVSVNLA